MNRRKPQTPEEVINSWCEFHLDDSTSRWPPGGGLHGKARVSANGFVYAGDGIIAALAEAGYGITKL